MNTKKIAFVLSGNYHTSLYLVTCDVVKELRQDGWQVDYVFIERPEEDLKDNDQYVDIHGLSNQSQRSLSGFKFRLLKYIFGRHIYQFLCSRYFSRQLDSHLKGYDAVIVHGSIFISFSSMSLPHYGVLHSCKYDNFLGRRKGLSKVFHQLAYRSVYSDKKLLAVSNSVKADMLDKMRATPTSLETIYNGFDFSDLARRAETGFTERVPDKFIMAAGRPDRTKRFDVLIRAYAKTKRTHKLVIFGEGRKLKELKQLAKQLGVIDDIVFWGFCKNLLPYYKRASAYILSSDIEGLPTVVVESLALNTPVVATDVGGVDELLSGRLSEWIVPKGDVDSLANKIDLVLEHPPKVGPDDISFLSNQVVSRRYSKLIEKLCD
ncbi:glycosyltransferase [Vibrio sp. 1CM23M]|uniref:glycosyltransferase n=1 Tax=Vibrio sp. 1CM23M TaxID=2929164 RepID=UPI0020BE865C|nr:glycosyltransferase [Vibrio sp. 1CM23M]MCK8073672.1 glycosyltransferase [Vibrio sp. 1CM23M]